MMEAKDTVMTWKQTVECSHNPCAELRHRDICLTQAQITWGKAIQAVVEKLEAWRAQGTHLISDEAIKALRGDK